MTRKIARKDVFLSYCKYYAFNKEREVPLNDRTLGRYGRGLNLVEKILGHNLEYVSNSDQLRFIQGIMEYAQGTRRVSTQIFQRYIAWGIKNGHFTCENLIVGKENEIIGENTPPSYVYLSRRQVREFFKRLEYPRHRIIFGLMYYCGLNTPEVLSLRVGNIQPEGIFVYRTTMKESQIIPVARHFMAELEAFTSGREESEYLVGPHNTETLNAWFKRAQVETNCLFGTNLRDLRTSGIRHFFEECNDIVQTKKYAGIPTHRKGWLEKLIDPTYYQQQKIARLRGHTEKAQEIHR